MRTEPLAPTTIYNRLRKANFGNIWVTELLSDGSAVQDFYALHAQVLRGDGKVKVLQYDGSRVSLNLDMIVGVGKNRMNDALDVRRADPNDPINRCDFPGCFKSLFEDGTTLAQNDIAPDFCEEHDVKFRCDVCSWRGDLTTVGRANEQFFCPNCGADESGMEIEGKEKA